MATINAANPSNTAIQAAIDIAADGDTVSVPSGTATWTGGVTVPATKGVSVIGGGQGNTICTLGSNLFILDTRPTNSPVRLSGFTFAGITTQDGVRVGQSHLAATIGATNWRIDHCTFPDNLSVPTKLGVYGYTFGVIDNCDFTNAGRAIWVDMQVRPQDVTPPYDYPGGYSWKQPISKGGPLNVYIEDCTFYNPDMAILFNCRAGARVVIRHNTATGQCCMETHSGCTPGYRNNRWIEVYDNTWNKTLGLQYWNCIDIRAQNGIIYNNTVTGNYQSYSVLNFDFELACTRPNVCAAPWPPYTDTVYWSTYPAQDQIGFGQDTGWGTPQSSTEAKFVTFNNTFNGTRWDFAQNQGSPCVAEAFLIQNNREFYQQVVPFTGSSGVGVGTLGERPSPSVSGVFYWATDQSCLYRANDSLVWEEHYRPYTYPHPLRGTGPMDTPLSISASAHAHAVDNIILTTGGSSQDFSLSAVPVTRTTAQRGTVTYLITATPAGGYNRSIDLSVSGLPVGCTGVFDSTRISHNGQATLTINTVNMTGPVGTYTVRVWGNEVP